MRYVGGGVVSGWGNAAAVVVMAMDIGRHRRQRGERGGLYRGVDSGGDSGITNGCLGERCPRALAAVDSAVDLTRGG